MNRASIIPLLLLAVMSSRPVQGQPPASKPSQDDIQAVYLFNFGKFVRWPAGSETSPMKICVAGNPSFGATVLKTVGGERIDGRTVLVQHIDPSEDVTACAIVFIDTSGKNHLAVLLAAASRKPILTVSDTPGFLDRGGMIQFLLIDHRVRFAVSLTAVQQAGLSLSSELLKVAVTVDGKPSSGGVQ